MRRRGEMGSERGRRKEREEREREKERERWGGGGGRGRGMRRIRKYSGTHIRHGFEMRWTAGARIKFYLLF